MNRSWCRSTVLVLAAVLVTGCSSTDPDRGNTDPATAPGTAARPAPPAAPDTAEVDPADASLALPATDRPRVDRRIASGGRKAPYNYAPSVLAEPDGYRMWWCSQLPRARPAGDDVLYGRAANLAGPFSVRGGGHAKAVFGGGGRGFDAKHTCDPSVLHRRNGYLMYYTGSAGDREHGNAVGLARSADGVHWRRSAEPVVRPSGEHRRANAYGAGQPSALFLDGWYYLMFTDTSGAGAGPNGAGQFVLRSPDPEFNQSVESLGEKGFVPVSRASSTRERSIVDAFSADWMWVDALQAFAVAHETATGTSVTFWNREFTAHPYRSVVLHGPWQEGPGLVRTGDGHAPYSRIAPCSRVPIDVVRATKNAAAPTDLAHFGFDLHGMDGCPTPQRALSMLHGYAMPDGDGTKLVAQGSVLRVQRREVAEAVATRMLDAPVPVLADTDIAATLFAGAPAVREPGGRIGLLLDDGRLWPVGSAKVAELNFSPITDISAEEWDSRPRGADLGALPGRSAR